jgi:hypothetical protein
MGKTTQVKSRRVLVTDPASYAFKLVVFVAAVVGIFVIAMLIALALAVMTVIDVITSRRYSDL